MNFPSIYPIININENSIPLIEKLLRSKIEILQLRAKSLNQNDFLEISLNAIKLKSQLNSKAKIIINDSVEIALKSNADGVHLGQGDTSPKQARDTLGTNKIIGLSTHNLEQIKDAPQELLNYLALGPIFETSTKLDHDPVVGLELIPKAKMLSRLPLVAIGGINSKNASAVYNSGADCVAGISDFENNLDLDKLIEKYLTADR